jgi:uncharacterized protein YlxP (DUF503 family)
MIVGVCRITLQLEDCHNEKDRRSVLRRIKDRVQQKWNCAIAEVGDTESLETAQLAFVVLSTERSYTQSLVQKILSFVEDLAFARIVDDEQDFLDYGDGSIADLSDQQNQHFEPDEPGPPIKRAALIVPRPLAPAEYPWDSPTVDAPIAEANQPSPRKEPADR